MRGDPQPGDGRRAWARAANHRLASLGEAVESLRKAFEADPELSPAAAAAITTAVVSASAALTDWLSRSRAPRGLGKAEAELGASAGVYRNAAFAFRSLTDAEVEQRQARSIACATMLEQGDHHVEAFTGALAQKLGDS